MANIDWQNWSEFGQVGVSLAGPNARSLEMDGNFSDTWHYALGARYRLDSSWSVSTGIAYDSSPVSNAGRTIALPVDRQCRYAVGLQYSLREALAENGTRYDDIYAVTTLYLGRVTCDHQ